MKLVTLLCCVFYNIKSLTCSKEELTPYFGKDYINDDSTENNNDMLIYLKSNDEVEEEIQQHDDEQYAAERKAGDMRDLLGSNVHIRQPNIYENLGRRSMTNNHPYSTGFQKRRNRKDANDDRLIPVKAPPEFVLAVAKDSKKALEENEVDENDEIVQKNILRSGDFWDSVWVENVDPEKIGKTRKDDLGPKLGTVKTQIMPGTELYRLVSVLKQISPRLVYVMNRAERK